MRVTRAFLALLAVSACGYRFAAGVTLPPGVRSLSVRVFENHTPEPQAGAIFAQAMAEELERQATRQEGEDAVVEGRVLLVTASPSGLGPGGTVGLWTLRTTVHFRVMAGERLLYEEPALSWEESFLPGRDVLDTESARRLAMHRAAHALAHELLGRLAARGGN